jgi:hypothetical protein
MKIFINDNSFYMLLEIILLQGAYSSKSQLPLLRFYAKFLSSSTTTPLSGLKECALDKAKTARNTNVAFIFSISKKNFFFYFYIFYQILTKKKIFKIRTEVALIILLILITSFSSSSSSTSYCFLFKAFILNKFYIQ